MGQGPCVNVWAGPPGPDGPVRAEDATSYSIGTFAPRVPYPFDDVTHEAPNVACRRLNVCSSIVRIASQPLKHLDRPRGLLRSDAEVHKPRFHFSVADGKDAVLTKLVKKIVGSGLIVPA